MKLRIHGVQFGYNSVDVLQNVLMEVATGEVVSLVGPNGAGKSTLLKCINKILKPRRGSILIEGKEVARFGLKELARSIGYVPQSVSYNFQCTVFDSVLLGRKPHVNWSISERDKDIVSEMLVLMGLEDMVMRQFNELSGGERQKVLIARALAQEPQILLLDEPTSNLDLRHQFEVLELITTVVREKGLSAIMAIHDLNLASRFSDKMVFLRGGRIYATGSPWEALTQENIRTVYGIDVIVNNQTHAPHIIPIGIAAGWGRKEALCMTR